MSTLEKPKRPVGRPRGDGRPHLTRDAVLQTAAKLIARHGFAGASIRMLAAELDAAPASLFNLFASKDALLDELIAYAAAPSLAFYAALQAAGAAPGPTLYRTIYEEVALVASIDPDYPALFYLPELRQPQFVAARQARRDMTRHYLQLIEQGVATGEFLCDSPPLAAEQMLQLTETSLLAGEEVRATPPDVQARATARLCLRSLLADPGRLAAVETAADRIGLGIILPPPAATPLASDRAAD